MAAKKELSSRELRAHGKKYRAVQEKIQLGKAHKVIDAFNLLSQLSYAKFDETVDLAINLGIDAKQSDQLIRGAIVLPHGTGKSARIAVIAKGDKAKEAQSAGADFVGSDDLIQKISEGWLEFDRVIATPDMMVAISKVAKILGPKGLMPNPKLGTVTPEVGKAVTDQKKGKVEYRTDKSGIVHLAIGKKSFGPEKLKDNFLSVLSVILKAKPPTSKGTYLKKITVSATMSPGLQIDPSDATQGSVGAA